MALLPPEFPARLDALLHVEADHRPHLSKSPRPRLACRHCKAVSHLTAKLGLYSGHGVLTLDLTWLNNNLQKALARHAAQASVQRLRLLAGETPVAYRAGLLLQQTYHETLDRLRGDV